MVQYRSAVLYYHLLYCHKQSQLGHSFQGSRFRRPGFPIIFNSRIPRNWINEFLGKWWNMQAETASTACHGPMAHGDCRLHVEARAQYSGCTRFCETVCPIRDANDASSNWTSSRLEAWTLGRGHPIKSRKFATSFSHEVLCKLRKFVDYHQHSLQ